MPTLFVNGDSHSAGHDAGGIANSYGAHLAQQLNYNLICQATPGCANQTIIRTTYEYLDSNQPDFIVIGWSTWEREEWYHDGKYYYVTSSGFDKLPSALIDQYKQWVIDSTTPQNQKSKEISIHSKIHNLHLYLTERKIKHLFFNCYSYFHYIKHWSLPQFNWGENYINPYDQNFTYYFWLENQGFKPSNPKYYHYGADAQLAWAEFLLPKINFMLNQN